MFNKDKLQLSASTIIDLTDYGKRAAEKIIATTPREIIMDYIGSRGESTVAQISQGTRIPLNRVQGIIRQHTGTIFHPRNSYEG